ncbi:coatomer WD associated region-domain-containing protein [Cladochytrium replicatum]|nr:coatomer WD associated region-domain-containing protein [Cladochytrium replicatum]
MLTKFETKSNRVKGLSFHPKRPWILASLYNGTVQLWDYKMGTLLERFEEHEGPVRGVDFHNNQPLFVSGGDDHKIKVWNWKVRRCLFTLHGHLDYIRTVFFHHEAPWIISASDDQSIRIWNWQSRNCISILTGHTHWVMCAQFHPKDDLVVSASLDQTVRVWDISGLRKKHMAPSSGNQIEDSLKSQQADIFGNTDAVVKYVLEGHDRAVNWVAFHPTQPLIVSSSDDRLVKLWRMNETRAWEVDTCRGHYNNVSSVLFHPRSELIISNSEDKTIRIWDMGKRTALQTFRREQDRFWIITAHPELNLFAAGHDGGLIVFKLERERPAHQVHQSQLFYVKEKSIRMYDFARSSDDPVVSLRKSASNGGLATAPRALSYNPAEHAALITTAQDGGTYELYSLPKETGGDARDASDVKKGSGNSAVFVARNRFAVLDKTQQQIYIKDLRNETTKQFKAPTGTTDVSYAGGKNILITTATSVVLFDTEQRQNVAELVVSGVRYVVWSPDNSMVALMAKHSIVIANKKLEQLCLIHEQIRVKSGVWDESGVFLYSTLNHVKYTLWQGDNGIIQTLDQVLYLTRINGKSLYGLDRDGKVRLLTIDPTEYKFKLALVRRNYDEVLNIIRTSNLVGQSIIAYLQKKGYPEVALQFVKDHKTRFELALECGNLDVAIETANAMNREDCWLKLAVEALRQGSHHVVEMTYQRTKSFDRLSFLYLITGNIDKLKKMLKIAELRNDVMSRYHNALYLGDIEDQVMLLKDAGQAQLAYLTAKSHGLEEQAEAILADAGLESPPELPSHFEPSLLKTPTPILKQFDQNWPLHAISKGFFEGGLFESHLAESKPSAMLSAVADDSWAEEPANKPAAPSVSVVTAIKAPVKPAMAEDDDDLDGGDGWDMDDDIDVPSDASPVSEVPHEGFEANLNGEPFRLPVRGTSLSDMWVRRSPLAVDHVAAGSFDTAFQLLNRQVGAVNFAELKPILMSVWMSSRSYLQCNLGSPSVAFPLLRLWNEEPEKTLPYSPVTLPTLVALLQAAYAETTQGRFPKALSLFKKILHSIVLVTASSEQNVEEIQQLLGVASEYVLGLRMQIARKGETDMKRGVELAVYFTHCDLQPAHLHRALTQAMAKAFEAKNFNTVLGLAGRLTELNPDPAALQTANKYSRAAQRTPTDEIALEYDSYNPFVICAASFRPIYRGSASVKCPFCKAEFKPEFSGQLCTNCEISQVGATGTGLRLL